MPNSIIDQDLEKAVRAEDIPRIRALISAGANVNQRISPDNILETTLLHECESVNVLRELLLHGARVDGQNRFRETPLFWAMSKGRSLAIIEELLKHGAEVDAISKRGITPLNRVIRENARRLDVIKVLLEHGADINVKCKKNFSPLDNAIRNSWAAVELLIKITLAKNFDRNYDSIIDLAPYRERRRYGSYQELLQYKENCICELAQMKTDKISNNLSMYEFVMEKNVNVNNLLQAKNAFENEAMSVKYPIYHDMILEKKEKFGRLSAELKELQVYTNFNVSTEENQIIEKKIILDYDSTYIIAKYLCNNDLINFITAFYKPADQSSDFSDNLDEMDKELDDGSGSPSSKRMKVE